MRGVLGAPLDPPMNCTPFFTVHSELSRVTTSSITATENIFRSDEISKYLIKMPIKCGNCNKNAILEETKDGKGTLYLLKCVNIEQTLFQNEWETIWCER